MTELPAVLGLFDVIYINVGNLVSQALFIVVTDRAGVFADYF